MAHDYKTRTIDYSEKHPPEWATSEEKINFYPKKPHISSVKSLDEQKPYRQQMTIKRQMRK